MKVSYHRGDILICATKGDYGSKPRPVVVVQSDLFNPTHTSVTVCPITSELVAAPQFRIKLMPTKTNGLTKTSQVMLDKLITIRLERVKQRVGKLSPLNISKIDAALKLWLGLS
jgi:mRNA interferase MazF